MPSCERDLARRRMLRRPSIIRAARRLSTQIPLPTPAICAVQLKPRANANAEVDQWLREGRTILVSSHLLAEVQQTVDAALIISGGRLVFEGSLADLAYQEVPVTLVDSPDRGALVTALEAAGVPLELASPALAVPAGAAFPPSASALARFTCDSVSAPASAPSVSSFVRFPVEAVSS